MLPAGAWSPVTRSPACAGGLKFGHSSVDRTSTAKPPPPAASQASERSGRLQPLRLVFDPVALRRLDPERVKSIAEDWMLGKAARMDETTFELLALALVRSKPEARKPVSH